MKLLSNQCRTLFQVSDYLEFGKEDSPEEKAAALASVVSVGEHVWVKCVHILGRPLVLAGRIRLRKVCSATAQ